MASANKSLGKFDLTDIPPAPRGMPQIEVIFDIDANGILNVSAKDKATGKEQSIIIKASSGLSEAEIEKMVNDAAAHADEDKKFHELVAARNQADTLVYSTEKSLADFGDKVDSDEKTKILAAVEELRSVIKSDDKTAIEEKTAALSELAGKLSEKMYAAGAAAGAPNEGDAGGSDGDTGSGEHKAADDNVVDAEFEEVKDAKEGKK